MNNCHVHAEADEPTTRLILHDLAQPFVVVAFGTNCDITSKDPEWCRRVAAAWTHAAELLEPALARAREHAEQQAKQGAGPPK